MNKKIIVLHNIISPYKTLLFNALSDLYNNLTILYISCTETGREWDIRKDDMRFSYEIMFDRPLDAVSRWALFVRTWNRLNVLNPDLVIIDGYSYASCWSGFFWAKLHRRPLILWSSSNSLDHRRVFYKEWIKKFLVVRCDAYNVYGSRSRDYLIQLGAKKDKIFVVGNNTDNTFYYQQIEKFKGTRAVLCKQYGIPENNFLYIGRFAPEKNLLRLLEAYRKIRINYSGWGLILVGNGALKEEIENYIRHHNIPDVLLPGFKQKEEISQFFAISNVFVLPSLSEAWGLVVNEAMASGLPVLVSRNCGCYLDLVKDGENGFSFDPYNTDELVELMRKVIDGKVDLRIMGDRARQIIESFTPERAAEIVVETTEAVHNAIDR